MNKNLTEQSEMGQKAKSDKPGMKFEKRKSD